MPMAGNLLPVSQKLLRPAVVRHVGRLAAARPRTQPSRTMNPASHLYLRPRPLLPTFRRFRSRTSRRSMTLLFSWFRRRRPTPSRFWRNETRSRLSSQGAATICSWRTRTSRTQAGWAVASSGASGGKSSISSGGGCGPTRSPSGRPSHR